MNAIRLLIIAADSLARAGLAALIGAQPQLTIVGQVAPGDDLRRSLEVFRPEAVLWDLGWEASPALDALAAFAETAPPLLALISGEAAAGAVWAGGVRGLLRRTLDGEQLAAAVRAVVLGLAVVDPDFALSLRPPLGDSAQENLFEELTPRELDVLAGMADGLSNKLIARQLEISEHTVKYHVNAILGKLNAQSRTEAVVRATRAGLILL